MRAVNTISLNGNAWQIESEGCEALAAYLKIAETRLSADPDRQEILADLEQAIADKLSRHVSGAKNVVTAEEIAQVLREMGPVEPGAGAGTGESEPQPAGPGPATAGAAQASAGAGARSTAEVRHLYRIHEGEMVGGVCNGLAAYFGVDVTVVRVMFVLFAAFTGGVGAAVYLVMMMVVPVAVTAEQLAQAHGKPFNAEELIGRPRAAFDAGRHWRDQWRDQRRMWRDQRRQWRAQRRAWSASSWPGAPYPAAYAPIPYGAGPLSAVIHVLLLIGFLVALVGAIAGRPVLGWDWAALVPHWVGIVAVCVVYGTLVRQMRMARYYAPVGAYDPVHPLVVLIGTVVWLLVLLSVGWYVVHHWPEVENFLQRALQAIQDAFDNRSPHVPIST
ncbi:MAG TPA: PspC domain-containing protein [Steroidobacteraceae bacterium]|nr:PspC domain-containing protein [Steroidobacteraceae bacterium]